MSRLRRLALGLARSRPGGAAVALATRAAPGLVPSRIHLDSDLVVLRHPVPMEPVHLLVLPRRPIADAHEQSDAATRFWTALGAYLPEAAPALNVTVGVTNVGARQEVPLLHVHLLRTRLPWIATGAEGWTSSTLTEAMARRAGDPQTRRHLAAVGSYGFAIPPPGAPWAVAIDPPSGTAPRR